TRAAWLAAGVVLPRTARGQVAAGPRVATRDLRAGDLVFHHADMRHVGLYSGGGRMIHAPGPGTGVREDPVHHQPVYRSVRPG
ncbi:C40 family peptidase, partial [Streptomyces bambusae]